jgi:hypothetical protein
MLGAKIVTMTQGRPAETSQTANISREQAAQLVNADVAGIDRARKVVKLGAPELAQAVERGELSANAKRPRVQPGPRDYQGRADRSGPGIVQAAYAVSGAVRRAIMNSSPPRIAFAR